MIILPRLARMAHHPALAVALGLVLVAVAIFGLASGDISKVWAILILVVGAINMLRAIPHPDRTSTGPAKPADDTEMPQASNALNEGQLTKTVNTGCSSQSARSRSLAASAVTASPSRKPLRRTLCALTTHAAVTAPRSPGPLERVGPSPRAGHHEDLHRGSRGQDPERPQAPGRQLDGEGCCISVLHGSCYRLAT